MIPVQSWGRLTREGHEVLTPIDPLSAREMVCEPGRIGLPHGLGRSYGDVCLNPKGRLWTSLRLNRFVAFDPKTGLLTVESGVQLREIQQHFVTRGWTLPVTPGTQYVTIGGAIANDVHGKNHHLQGTFGDHVEQLTLQRTDGSQIRCGPQMESEWFRATLGGLGLTGLILDATLRLQPIPSAWLDTETIPYRGIDEFLSLSEESEKRFEFTVSWFDCLSSSGRGLFMRGNWCQSPPLGKKQVSSRQRSLPFTPPISLMNSASLRLFNSSYYSLHRAKPGRQLSHYQHFFYPLDALLHWNRIYGPKGFFQYQCVIPNNTSDRALKTLLNVISKSGTGSFLAVLKRFGDRPPTGLLSFSMPGVTLALDFPNQGDKTARLFERLDQVILDVGGRIYPAKDARMPKGLFEKGYGQNLEIFERYRDPGISSGFSRRLLGH